jgi:putative flavoprotein involved in K+ transport
VANVVWCTGFGKDTGWITFPCLGADGWPDQKEGVATGVPGLYFVGLPFLRSFSSMLIGGVGRDAESVARHITTRRTARRTSTPVPVAERHD